MHTKNVQQVEIVSIFALGTRCIEYCNISHSMRVFLWKLYHFSQFIVLWGSFQVCGCLIIYLFFCFFFRNNLLQNKQVIFCYCGVRIDTKVRRFLFTTCDTLLWNHCATCCLPNPSKLTKITKTAVCVQK